MKTKKASERNIAMKVKNGVRKNIAAEMKKSNKIDKPLSPDLLRKMNAYWRAANYLSVGQIYLYDNPLLSGAAEIVAREAAGGRALGNDTRPELIYVHLNRVIKSMTWICSILPDPVNGGPGDCRQCLPRRNLE